MSRTAATQTKATVARVMAPSREHQSRSRSDSSHSKVSLSSSSPPVKKYLKEKVEENHQLILVPRVEGDGEEEEGDSEGEEEEGKEGGP
jgi:hypothetical protein